MSLTIRAARDKGNKNKERVVLYAEADVDIGEYILFDTTYLREGAVSNKLRHSIWLPDIKVDAGDLVVIYTKAGTPKYKKNSDGSRTHFLYWNIDVPIWNKDDDCAVLVKIADWDMKIV